MGVLTFGREPSFYNWHPTFGGGRVGANTPGITIAAPVNDSTTTGTEHTAVSTDDGTLTPTDTRPKDGAQ